MHGNNEDHSFKDVFPTLDLYGDLALYMEEVRIIKITKEDTNELARVYIESDVLIPKDVILKVESLLEKKVFRNFVKHVRVLDRYKLPENYTPEVIFGEYKDSIELELNRYFKTEYQVYRESDIFFTETGLKVIMPEGFFSEMFGHELVDYFYRLFRNRFYRDVNVKADFKDSVTGRFELEKQHRLQVKIQEINDRLNGNDRTDDLPDEALAEASKASNNIDRPAEAEETKEKSKGVLYGRDFEGEAIPVSAVDDMSQTVIIAGMVRKIDLHPIRNEKTIVKYDITDFTDTITVSIFVKDSELDALNADINKGDFVKVKGNAEFNKFEQDVVISRVWGIKRSGDTREVRNDYALHKRVELHCHTKMSDMDGVSYAKDLIETAKRWGHKAIAITDHGVVQAFPECAHAIQKDDDFQVIYGVEAYLVDDDKQLAKDPGDMTFEDEFVVFDLETTGFSATHDRIIEIGAVKVKRGEIVDRFSTFVDPEIPIPFKIEKLTSISDADVRNAPTIEEILPKFIDFIGDAALVAHNADFDVSFIMDKSLKLGIDKKYTVLDTVHIAQFLHPGLSNFKLDTLVKHTGVVLSHHHRAVDDAEATAGVFINFLGQFKERDIFTLKDLNKKGRMGKTAVMKLHPYHCILLASTEEGKDNLYRLVSRSHLEYFNRVPKIPKTLLNEYRKGLIVGSACESGELYQALLSGRSREMIARIVNFYDYLEIQPLSNNAFLIDDENSFVKSYEDLINLNRKIAELGRIFNKPVVATGDVHFLNPEDAIYRTIIQADKNFKDADNQPPLYLKTTDEMLEEFSYLGEDKAFEVVVTNPNRIRLMCERISPVRPDKCPPVIENSDQMLRDICYDRAHEVYGPDLPDIVEARLERELNSIISNGYSVMYIIAQKLVWKSNDDGYLVGSRGSVGSSFAATMAGITEVNPLSPHYLCPECYYVDFDSEEVLKHSGGAGCDMPDKICPKCGAKLNKMGFDIPFETFLGFKGDKEPDIDLNFSNVYQSKAHAFTEVIFGKGQTFKAGTIGTVAEKTAYGLTWKYFKNKSEEMGTAFTKRRCEIERIAEGCVEVRRTTGQHPGGIVVLPFGEDINTFTPVQHPANDMKTDIVTTHFDYHSIDHNLLKLDILGHLDPTMIRRLQDLTGKDPLEIPLDSQEVMSLFKSTEILKISPEDIGGTELGTLGVPEFGTDFAMGMLKEAKPTKFSDLVRIAGLAHGTDVWLGNTQELLRQGTVTISTAICTRDDIMTYLISMGMDSALSFNIMEAVRKGKGLKPEWEESMRAANVPDWYIWSCNKIKYMFPKAHAAAYVMMAWRVAYCKIFYPLEYYCAYFSIRAKAFDYEKMAMGRDKLDYYIKEYRKKAELNTITDPEKEELKDMRLAEEMYARGFDFMPIDIYKAKARDFQIFNGKIMPSLKVVDKVGEVAGESIEIAASAGNKFLSKEDLMKRAKVGQTVIDKLSEIHALDGFTESNQLTLFDFN
ncbi:MAG: PolC-type DNA polymerase III [Clostridiales bacterium]|nr:PolC-type DNA polymerase III [Clostridiales bacterium]MBS5877734.1 PolC-type DNA polymerase III [Clostridiales bacterium]MDU0939643.1 PolC-type DNA polymerase III [Clostridiales bacterium]MDU1042566.1 PolC-type DNA polymerase III [Clostridiales bacterium]